jgi:hypothetical protein
MIETVPDILIGDRASQSDEHAVSRFDCCGFSLDKDDR